MYEGHCVANKDPSLITVYLGTTYQNAYQIQKCFLFYIWMLAAYKNEKETKTSQQSSTLMEWLTKSAKL